MKVATNALSSKVTTEQMKKMKDIERDIQGEEIMEVKSEKNT